MRTHLVSIIMPMRNAEAFVRQALVSVLAEQQAPLEVIVVDDGSTDNSRSIVQSLGDQRIRVIAGPCSGISAALNMALAHASGEIVMRCDADDLYPSGRIAAQTAWLDEHPEFGATCGAFVAMDPAGRTTVSLQMSSAAEEITAELRNGVTRTHLCTYAIRSSVLDAIGGARTFFVTSEDIDLQLRLGEACRVWYSPDVLYHYRIHDASITHRVRSAEKQYYDSQALHFQQQRREDGVDDLQRGLEPAGPEASTSAVDSSAAHLQGLLIADMWAAIGRNETSGAMKAGFRAVLVRPASWIGWRQLLVGSVKLAIAKSRPQ